MKMMRNTQNVSKNALVIQDANYRNNRKESHLTEY